MESVSDKHQKKGRRDKQKKLETLESMKQKTRQMNKVHFSFRWRGSAVVSFFFFPPARSYINVLYKEGRNFYSSDILCLVQQMDFITGLK